MIASYVLMQHMYYVLSSASSARVGTVQMKDHADRQRQLLLQFQQQVLPEEIPQGYSHDLAGSAQLSNPGVKVRTFFTIDLHFPFCFFVSCFVFLGLKS